MKWNVKWVMMWVGVSNCLKLRDVIYGQPLNDVIWQRYVTSFLQSCLTLMLLSFRFAWDMSSRWEANREYPEVNFESNITKSWTILFAFALNPLSCKMILLFGIITKKMKNLQQNQGLVHVLGDHNKVKFLEWK